MDEPDTALEPIDRAYANAEALLADDAARAQRRARVLGEIARTDAARRAGTPVRTGRSMMQSGGWLAAAGVVGLSLFVATQAPQRPPIATPAARRAPAAGALVADAASAPTQKSTDHPPVLPKVTTSNAPRIAAAPLPVVPTPRSGAPMGGLARGPDAPAETDKAANAVTDARPEDAIAAAAPVVVPRAEAFAASPPPPPRSAAVSALRAAPSQADRLSAAAAAGRAPEVEDLLARGTPVDARDADGDTALMKSVVAGRVKTAALLRGRGASLDRKNRAGLSVRDVAKAIDDPDMNQALGVKSPP